jgi:hypothetical protein
MDTQGKSCPPLIPQELQDVTNSYQYILFNVHLTIMLMLLNAHVETTAGGDGDGINQTRRSLLA